MIFSSVHIIDVLKIPWNVSINLESHHVEKYPIIIIVSLLTWWPKKSEIMKIQYFDREQQPATVSVAMSTPPVPSCCIFTPLIRSKNKYDQHLLKNKEPAMRCITSGIIAPSLKESTIYFTASRIISSRGTTRKLGNTAAMVSLVKTIFLVARLRLRYHEDSL